MCKRCMQYFTIHDAIELDKTLTSTLTGYKTNKESLTSARKDLLAIWLERGYFTNLIYLEYLSNEKESH